MADRESDDGPSGVPGPDPIGPDGLTDGGPGDAEAVARIICLRLLEQRARSRVELAGALHRRGVPLAAANVVLDRLSEVGLIDDAALADGFARAQHAERGLSARAVALKLRRRGIEEEQVQEAVGQISQASEREAAERLIRRRLPGLVNQPVGVQARRLVGLLARRGYAPGLANDVVRTVLAETAAELEYESSL